LKKFVKRCIKLLVIKILKKDLIYKGYENVKNFSWEKCAKKTLNVLISL